MNYIEVKHILRRLAKRIDYQSIFSQEKMKLKIFKNDIDLTAIQLEFLDFLGFYNNLYLDYALGEIGEIIFDNEIYEDSYMKYKHSQKKIKKEKPTNTPKYKDRPQAIQNKFSTSKWLFKRKK